MHKTIWLITLASSVLLACNRETGDIEKDDKMEDSTQTITTNFLALGDSYTIGESVEDAERWPMQLKDSLLKYDFRIDSVKIIARTGWRTDQLIEAIAADDNLAPSYGLVSLLIGVNNQYQSRDFSQFEQEFSELLTIATSYAGTKDRVIVLSIPDYSVTPFVSDFDKERVATELERYNQRKKEICDSLGYAFFDITPISRKGAEDPTYIADDRLHPSGKMYAEWVNLMVGEVANTLKKIKN